MRMDTGGGKLTLAKRAGWMPFRKVAMSGSAGPAESPFHGPLEAVVYRTTSKLSRKVCHHRLSSLEPRIV
jgi:hypothetical protein